MKFLVDRPQPAPEVERRVLAAMAARVPPENLRKLKRKGTPWASWDPKQRAECAQYCKKHGYKALGLKFGRACPPASTVRGWMAQVAADAVVRAAGRPGWLTEDEEKTLLRVLQQVRQTGAVLDAETICFLGEETLRELRGPGGEQPTLTRHWAQSFRCARLLVSLSLF